MTSAPHPDPVVSVGSDQPKAWDLVLGGQAPPAAPAFGLVLGGIEGARRRLSASDVNIRLATIAELPTYQESGISLLIEALQTNTEWPVRLAAWQCLSQLEDPTAQQAIYDYSPFRHVGGSRGLIVAYRRGERDFSYADLPNADLKGASLGGISFWEANLKNADLQQANCNGTHFGQTDLRGVNFTGAKLSGADFAAADLRGAIVIEVKLSGTSLRQVKLSEDTQLSTKAHQIWAIQNHQHQDLVLTEADLSKTDLSQTDLRGVDLTGANLEGVDLRRADLTGANLSQAYLVRADLRGANLREIDLSDAILFKANVKGVNLSGSDLSRADVTRADLSHSNLTMARIEGLKHGETRIEGTLFPDGTQSTPWWW